MPPSGRSSASSAMPITSGSTSSSRSRSWRIDARDAMAMTARPAASARVHAPCIARQQHGQQDAGESSTELEAWRQADAARSRRAGKGSAGARVARRVPASRFSASPASGSPEQGPAPRTMRPRKPTAAPVSPAQHGRHARRCGGDAERIPLERGSLQGRRLLCKGETTGDPVEPVRQRTRERRDEHQQGKRCQAVHTRAARGATWGRNRCRRSVRVARARPRRRPASLSPLRPARSACERRPWRAVRGSMARRRRPRAGQRRPAQRPASSTTRRSPPPAARTAALRVRCAAMPCRRCNRRSVRSHPC